MTLDTAPARCLAKTPHGKPNGCHKADYCARHVAIRTDHPQAYVWSNDRMCGPEEGVHAFFIHADARQP
ncbi:MAG: hypothetical protein ABFC42_10275 [Sulfuricella sp.]